MWMVIIGVVGFFLMIGGWRTLDQCTRVDVPREYRPWWAKDDDNQAANESQAIIGGVICVVGCGFVCVAISQLISKFIHLY